jgi:2-methylcitrate dehydratase
VAAFVNGTMVRYFDFNDGYIGDEPGHEPGHPSDNIAACLAVAEAEGRSGKELITAIVLAYEIQMRFQDAANLYRQGWDHVNYVLISSTVAAAKLMGLTGPQMVEAINIAVNSHIALRQVRTGQLSAWKASSAPNATRNAIVAAQLARAGFTGPSPIFEGRAGFAAQVTGELTVDPGSFAARPNDRYQISRSLTKLLPTNGEMQSAVWAAIAVREALGDPARIESVEVATTQIGYFILAKDAEKWRPTTRETADHSLPYTVARTLLDGRLTVASYAPEAVTAPAVQALMDKITVVEDPELTAMTPKLLPNRVTVRTRDGAEFCEQVGDAAGGARKAMSDEQFEDKFRALLEDLAPEEQIARILDLVRSIDAAARVDELIAAAVLDGNAVPGRRTPA